MLLKTLLPLALWCALVLPAAAQPTTPFLTLNTEMHADVINRIDTDRDGRLLLTVSKDKTAKLWDAQSGELLRTLRVPIAEGNEGMLYAGALSPDAKIAAVAGWSYFDGKTHDIYLFDAQTGALLYRLGGLPNVINDLEFSPNGRYLVATLGGSNGARVYEMPSARLVASLTGYGADSYNAAFDRTGRLATVCYDGIIRLYDASFQLQKTVQTQKQPYSIAFSPDGSLLAVGYDDAPQLEVRDGKTLQLLYKPDITNAQEVDNRLEMVAFSACGNYLIAGGFYRQYVNGAWWRMIRVYTQQGRGSYADYPAAGNTILDIKPIQGNQFVFAGSQPDFGRMTLQGTKLFYRQAETHDYRANDKSHFLLNRAGAVVGVTPSGKNNLVFDFANRTLSQNTTVIGLEPYTDNAAGIRLTDWKDSRSPKLNGKAVSFLEEYETNRSVDISSDGQKIVWGADWHLYCTDAKGSVLWEAPTQAMALAVNLSGNHRVVAAALGDGTIRWYNADNGKKLLTLYLHPDNRRWIAWTPQGYFDCSAGAESLIGWHVNQGADKEALYYPVSRFRSTYYRPDVIDKIFQTYDESEAIRLANQESNRRQNTVSVSQALPPIVRILSPTANQEVSSEQLTVEYLAFSPNNEEILNVRFMIDGRPVETQRGLKPARPQGTEKKTIRIPQRDFTLQVLAENQYGWSVPAEVSLKWRGPSQTQSDILKPTLYILSVGVSQYQNAEYNLNFAAKDALDFSSAMLLQKGKLYKDVVVRALTNSQATKNNILDGLDWIQQQTTSRDVAMIFFAGHGINDNIGTFYFMPHDAQLESLRRTCLMFNEIKHTCSAIAGKVILFVDACHSGNVWGSNRRAIPDMVALANELADAENGTVVFTSSTGKQYSLENPEWNNGAFTKALVEGLHGKADLFGNGVITIKTLDAYVTTRVKELTTGKQSPTTIIPQSVPDFPVSVLRMK